MEHPRSVGESYCQHFWVASGLSARLGVACTFQLVHAIFPFVVPPFGSDVKSLKQLLKDVDPERRAASNSNDEDLDELFGAD